MLIKRRKPWDTIPESRATPESVYLDRRQWLTAAGFAGGAILVPSLITVT